MLRLVVRHFSTKMRPQDESDRRLYVTIGGKKVSTKERRWYKDVGLGFKTPLDAINGTYIGVCALFASFEQPIDGASENR